MGLINYVKTIWQNGITKRNAQNFNHMEDGIKSACDGVDRLDTAMPLFNNKAFKILTLSGYEQGVSIEPNASTTITYDLSGYNINNVLYCIASTSNPLALHMIFNFDKGNTTNQLLKIYVYNTGANAYVGGLWPEVILFYD